MARPLIGITCCRRGVGGRSIHAVTDKYVVAATAAAGGVPVLLPALGAGFDPVELADRLDGLLVTGSPSNIEPCHYGGAPSRPGTLHDRRRDATALPLLRAAVAADLPVLAICRGLQELNVALGGTLHQLLHETPGRIDHRAPRGTVAERYAHTAHGVRLVAGGLFERLAGSAELMVNSLHAQGIDRMAAGLEVEAVAPDGQIEGVRASAAGFILGVQWHPEFAWSDNPFSRALLAAFGAACRARQA